MYEKLINNFIYKFNYIKTNLLSILSYLSLRIEKLQNLISSLYILNGAPMFDMLLKRKKKIATINITISPKLSIIAIKFEETISNLTVYFFHELPNFTVGVTVVVCVSHYFYCSAESTDCKI